MDTDRLIDDLARQMRPVRPIRPPLQRAAGWLLAAAAIVTALLVQHGVRPDIADQLRDTAFLVATGASLLTGATAAIGCLLASLPDRSRAWLLLPLPPLAAWVSTIGYGCLTDWVSLDPADLRMGEALRCFATVLLVSLPLSAAMLAMLRHAARLRPTPVTLTAGLAVAGITSTCMALLHRLDATLMIVLWNLGTAVLIVAIEAAVGRNVLVRLQGRAAGPADSLGRADRL